MANASEQGEFITEQASRRLDVEVSSSPSKRPKTLTLTQTQSPISTSKGKEKIEEIKDENDEESRDSEFKTCGICLSEDGKAIRGWIDSCNHYFCFVCIMEWSKVESRCPMCKQRFGTIRRPPKDGVFLRERVVKVPICDQVYHPLGNGTTGPSDPYSQVQCTECHSSVDENLLLLCDLCDSGAHTYCVGLGATVPEGDWYCRDCTVLRDDHTNSQIDSDCCNQDFRNFGTTTVAGASVSISEIIQESYFLEVDRPPRRTSSHSDLFSSTVVPHRDISAGTRVTDPSARTLRRCRNVQGHIQLLRENWNSLRSGSLGFSSNLLDSDGKSNKKNNSGAVIYEKSSQLQLSSSRSCEQMTMNDNVSHDLMSKKGSPDIDRAWKMMNIAKSIQRAREGTNTDFQASNHMSGNRNVPKEATNTILSFSLSKSKPFEQKDLGGIPSKKNHKYHSLDIAHEKGKSQKSEKQNLRRDTNTMEETSKFHKRPPSSCASGYCELPSARQVRTSVLVDVCRENGEKQSVQVSNLISGQGVPACSVSLTGSSPRGSDPSYSRTDFGASSGCKAELPKEKGGVDKNSAEGMARKDDGAKSEVQSLVKLNLKLQSRDKRLGVDGFKEVARLATHTILAACGLEHTKSSVRSFPISICRHNDQSQQLRMSNLMPSSCRECFYVFVKDVVSSIMAEKIAHAQSTC